MERWRSNEGTTGICPRRRALCHRRGRLLLPSIPTDRNWLAGSGGRNAPYDLDLPVHPPARVQPRIPSGSDLFLTPTFVDGYARC